MRNCKTPDIAIAAASATYSGLVISVGGRFSSNYLQDIEGFYSIEESLSARYRKLLSILKSSLKIVFREFRDLL